MRKASKSAARETRRKRLAKYVAAEMIETALDRADWAGALVSECADFRFSERHAHRSVSDLVGTGMIRRGVRQGVYEIEGAA